MFRINPRRRFADTLHEQIEIHGGLYAKEDLPARHAYNPTQEEIESGEFDPPFHDEGEVDRSAEVIYWRTVLGGPYAGTYKLYKISHGDKISPRIDYQPSLDATLRVKKENVTTYNKDEKIVLRALLPFVKLVVQVLKTIEKKVGPADAERAEAALRCYEWQKNVTRPVAEKPSWAAAVDRAETYNPPPEAESSADLEEVSEDEEDSWERQMAKKEEEHHRQQKEEQRQRQIKQDTKIYHGRMLRQYMESQRSIVLENLLETFVGQIAQYLLILQGWSGIPFHEVKSLLLGSPDKLFDLLPISPDFYSEPVTTPSELTDCKRVVGSHLYRLKFDFKQRKAFATEVLRNLSIVQGYRRIFGSAESLDNVIQAASRQGVSASGVKKFAQLGLDLDTFLVRFPKGNSVKSLFEKYCYAKFEQQKLEPRIAVKVVNLFAKVARLDADTFNMMFMAYGLKSNDYGYPGNPATGVPPCRLTLLTPEGRAFISAVESDDLHKTLYWLIQLKGKLPDGAPRGAEIYWDGNPETAKKFFTSDLTPLSYPLLKT